MNDRIRELALEVFSFKYKTAPNELNPGHHMDHLHKFAELIIRECATLKLDPMQIDGAQYYHGWLDYRDEIWKHFRN